MKWLLTIVTAIALLVAVPFTARVQAQSTPPYYYQAGSSSIPSNQCTASAFTLTCGGLTGQGTCLAQWTGGGAGTISGSLIIATTSPRPAIVFYSSTGANLGNTVSDTGGPYFFKCPNVTGFTITDTVTPYSYVIVATPLAWPFLASDISPAPSASPVCGGDFSPAPIPAGGAGPTPTPANCYIAFGGAIIGPHPATPGPTVHAFVVSGDANVCVTGGNAGFVNWGLSDSQIIGTPVAATIWGAGCYNMNNNPGGGSSFLGAALDGAGDLAVNGSLYPGAGGSIFVQNGNAVNFTPASSTVAGCNLGNLGGTGPGPGVELVHATTGTCTFVLPDLATGALLCTNANSQVTTTGCPTPSPAPAPSISASPPIVASYNSGSNTYNVSCPTCTTGSAPATPTPITFSGTATGTNYDPAARSNPSSYFASTSTITPPTAPYVLHVRALVKIHSSTSPNYYGFLLSSDATHFLAFYNEIHGAGDATIGDSTVSTVSGLGNSPFPGSGGAGYANTVYLFDAFVTVTSAGQLLSGASVNGIGVSGGTSNATAIGATDVNLTIPFTVYALGAASTDVISASYSTGLGLF